MIDSFTQFLNEHWDLIISLVKIALIVFIVLTVNAYLTWFERKVVAHMQSRWGPHRVGPHGLLQPAADGLKFLLKEDPTPSGVDKFTYYLAPLMALALALTSIAIIPFGPDPLVILGHKVYLGIVDLNIGLLALFAITALSVYGVALAGWSSNSKYPLLGGGRSAPRAEARTRRGIHLSRDRIIRTERTGRRSSLDAPALIVTRRHRLCVLDHSGGLSYRPVGR